MGTRSLWRTPNVGAQVICIKTNISVSRYVNVLKVMPKFLLAKLTFANMWSLKVNLLSIHVIIPPAFMPTGI